MAIKVRLDDIRLVFEDLRIELIEMRPELFTVVILVLSWRNMTNDQNPFLVFFGFDEFILNELKLAADIIGDIRYFLVPAIVQHGIQQQNSVAACSGTVVTTSSESGELLRSEVILKNICNLSELTRIW